MQQQYNYVQRINDLVIVPCVFEYGMIVFLSINAYFFSMDVVMNSFKTPKIPYLECYCDWDGSIRYVRSLFFYINSS